MTKINIIIPTTFNPQLTYECIDSVKNHNMGIDYDITVIDNGSDPIFSMKDVTIIRKNERLWFSKAMNIGIDVTKDDYLLLLNNDTKIMHDNFLSNLLETMQKDPMIGIVSPTTNFIGTDAVRCANNESKTNQIFEFKGHIAAVCFLVRREMINKIGKFDEQFVNAFCDGDFCENALRNGYKIYIDGRNFLYHYGSRSVSQTPGYAEMFHKSHIFFKQKWGFQ
jgi:O-antigen biosynthesis protein